MSKAVIQRYISNEKDFKIICNHFSFLVEKIKKFGFEYSLEIRQDYFNLYYSGNSIGKIILKSPKKTYPISIHKKFLKNTNIKKKFSGKDKNQYVYFDISPNKLSSFFSEKNLKALSQRVKGVNYQEEISFEQALITDNIGREDFIIIDRQIVDHASSRKIDLLALKWVGGDNFQFCILEVKLGNNPELKGDVIGQLKGYVERIEDYFEAYKKSYERNFEQKRKLGLITVPQKVIIIPGVIGIVVVGGYGGIAEKSIKELKSKDKEIKILHLQNKIDFTKVY